MTLAIQLIFQGVENKEEVVEFLFYLHTTMRFLSADCPSLTANRMAAALSQQIVTTKSAPVNCRRTLLLDHLRSMHTVWGILLLLHALALLDGTTKKCWLLEVAMVVLCCGNMKLVNSWVNFK